MAALRAQADRVARGTEVWPLGGCLVLHCLPDVDGYIVNLDGSAKGIVDEEDLADHCPLWNSVTLSMGWRCTRNLSRTCTSRSSYRLPFATPAILDVEVHDGVLVAYERELRESHFRSEAAVSSSERELPATETAAVRTDLRALATVPGTQAMRRLTVQGDNRPL